MKELEGIDSTISTVDRVDLLENEVSRIKQQVLLLDLDLYGLNLSKSTSTLRRICSETKTIVMNGGLSEDMEWDLLKVGVRGYCTGDAKPEYLKHAVIAVQNGELWVRRSLTNRLLDEFGRTSSKNKVYRATLGLLNKLTQREYDIALHAGNGESNKEIAESLAITERTVKAHLSEIYNKLGIADRVNLALVLSADNRNASSKSGNPANPGTPQQLQLGGSRFNDKANHNQ